MQLAVPYGQAVSVTVLLSSHFSPPPSGKGLVVPSPQYEPVRATAAVQVALQVRQLACPYGQAASSTLLPSSQASPPPSGKTSRRPSPQVPPDRLRTVVQLESQRVQLAVPYGQAVSVTVLPSSQASPPPSGNRVPPSVKTTVVPSPQRKPVRAGVDAQVASHTVQLVTPYGHWPSVAVLPSSHASGRVPVTSRMPSPQTLSWQVLRQSSVLLALPSSHASPNAVLVVWSPQRGALQLALHVAVLTPPVSQSSPKAALTLKSPQAGVVQSESHAAVLTPDESHCSPAAPFT